MTMYIYICSIVTRDRPEANTKAWKLQVFTYIHFANAGFPVWGTYIGTYVRVEPRFYYLQMYIPSTAVLEMR